MIEFRTLGTLDLRDPGNGREFGAMLARPKRVALLAYLALAKPRGVHHRDTLLGIFWPETSQERARHALNQALYVLRRALGGGVVVTRGAEEIGIDVAELWCDAAAFEAAFEVGKWEEALKLYGGDLLNGFYLSDCPEFEQWRDGERARLRERASEAAWSLADETEEAGNAVAAAHWGRRAAAFAPGDEGALRRLMVLLDRVGDRTGALREYEAFAEQVRRDYEAEPAPETQELVELVRAREQANGGVLPSAVTKQTADAPVTRVTVVARRSWRTKRLAAVALVVLAAVTVASATLIRNSRSAPALGPTRVLVDIFQNETGDPSLDHLGRMATDRVTAGLTVTTFVDVVSLGTRLLSREPVVPDTGILEQADLQVLARANGTGTVVSGSYYLQGDSVHFLAHVTDAGTGEELATLEPVVGAIDSPVAAIEQLRDRVMTTLATLTDPRLTKWMRYASPPPTFEAYTEFVEGIELHTHLKFREAIPHFLRAAVLDPNFTMPSLWVGYAYGQLGQRALSDSIGQALNRRRGHLAPLDRLLLDHQLAWFRGDYESALAAMRRFVQIAPGSEFLYKAGQAALFAARYREAIEFLTQADPESGWLRGWSPYWGVLSNAYHLLGEHDRELETTRRGRQRYPEERQLISFEMRALHRLGDHERELEAARHGRRLHPDEPQMILAEVRALAALGRTEELRASFSEVFQRTGPSISSSIGELRAHGYPAAASDLVDRMLERFESRTSDWKGDTGQPLMYAMLLSRAERWDQSQAVLEDLLQVLGPPPFVRGTQRFIEHNSAALELAYVLARQGHRDQAFTALGLTRYSTRPVLRAQLEAALGERERAVELLRKSGLEADMHDIVMTNRWDMLLDYPPFQEFIRPKG